ncbi:probable RNA-binding protein 46 [Daphnia pulex]|uniref:probable RNA-binding protein 46 n=1 Tax=Daphnia pulex TaxID=6669 RepID=UPI001EDF6684|nr:probable RNA-binding protein 46 [Daphnia pulex]
MLRSGQRRYGGPPEGWTGPPPSKGGEVFVGKIPRDLMENELLPVFQTVGPVYEIRLMMDTNETNRGFAFVTFATPADAGKAIQKLNRYEIRPGRFIGVIRSMDNCRLFIGGIPKDKSEEEIHKEMSRITEGVVRVILYSSVVDKKKNRGFAFIEYESHRAAALARRKCLPDRLLLWGKNVAVDWAEPEPVVEEEILSKVRVLYVRNLLITTKEKELEELFDRAGNGGVEKVKILNDFAFIHFGSRSQAQQAMDALQDRELNGIKMQITWAKPVGDKPKRSNARSKLIASSTMLFTSGMTRQTRYPATTFQQMWPHFTFSHPGVIQPQNGLPLQAYPSYPLYPQQNTLYNYMMPGRRHNQLPINLYCNDYPPQTTSNFIGQQKNENTVCAATSHMNLYMPWTNGGYTDNVKILDSLCQLYDLGEPIIELRKGVDERYLAKITIPKMGLPYNMFTSADTYETEKEAQQAITGCAVAYVNQTMVDNGETPLSVQVENLSI